MTMWFDNPFTGESLTLNHPGHPDQSVHGRNHPSSLQESYDALQAEANKKAGPHSSEVPIEYRDYDPDEVEGFVEPGKTLWGFAIPDDYGRHKIQVGKGIRERELAAHELGHLMTGQLDEDFDENSYKNYIDGEEQAWDWAFKNRKRLGISRKKLNQLRYRQMAERMGDL